MEEKHKFTNRLINEKSPYLLQHAHNPVDWFPWGDEAFIAAKDNDKPIFLSIGYATCHWCHVMEIESFEDEEIAKLLNETFINIKVDREELPEVDSIYMDFAQSMMAGAAGWPLNVVLTPELHPFFATTYLPPFSSHGSMGLVELIERINEVWKGEEKERVIVQADKIVEIFEETQQVHAEGIPDKSIISSTGELLFKMADPIYGGIKGIPKFPIGYQSNFMIRYSAVMQDSRALFLVERTLDMMQRGGIYDHLGGGFSRYSVDEMWIVPHFEKMLYDNALLVFSYLEIWQVTKNDLYKNISEETLNYIKNEMTHEEGGFYSAEDADTEGKEGYYYTWTREEVEKILGKEQSLLFCEFFDITEAGNFEERNILHTNMRIDEFAQIHHLDPQEFEHTINSQKKQLKKVRDKRTHPFKDDKILTSWNGLMIHSFVEAGCAFIVREYIDIALKSATFIQNNLWNEDQLFRRWREGETMYRAGLDDYAYLIKGLLSLFEGGFGTHWLEWAMELTNILNAKFSSEEGAFYQTDGEDSSIILRKFQFSDGAEPSGNAIHCENLLRLYQITIYQGYLDQVEGILSSIKTIIENYPPGYAYHIMNLLRYYDQNAPTIVIALNDKKQFYNELHKMIYKNFIPHKVVIWKEPTDMKILQLIPWIKDKEPVDGKTTLYICHKKACKKPINEISEMLEALHRL